MTQIPQYRAKKKDSDEYVVGDLIKKIGWFFIAIQDTIDSNNAYDLLTFVDNGNIFEIDKSTLAIHFPDMLDSQGNKIFASLSEDGKGGDIVSVPYITPFGKLTEDEDYKSIVIIKNGVVQLNELNQIAIRDMMLDTTNGDYISNFGNKIIYGTHSIFKVIGIQQ